MSEKDVIESGVNKGEDASKEIYSIDAIIIGLEDKLKKLNNPNDYLEVFITKHQISKLRKLKNEYQKIKGNGVTEKTKNKLGELLGSINNDKKTKQIGGIIREIDDTIENEVDQRQDNIFENFSYSMRDFIEEHINFNGIDSSKVLDNFFDIFTVKYLDYLSNIKKPENFFYLLSVSHDSTKDLEGLYIQEEKLDFLVKETLKAILMKGENLGKKEMTITYYVKGKGKTEKIYNINNETRNIGKEVMSNKLNSVEKKIESVDDDITLKDIISISKEIESYGNLFTTLNDNFGSNLTINKTMNELFNHLNERIVDAISIKIQKQYELIQNVNNKKELVNIKKSIQLIVSGVKEIKNYAIRKLQSSDLSNINTKQINDGFKSEIEKKEFTFDLKVIKENQIENVLNGEIGNNINEIITELGILRIKIEHGDFIESKNYYFTEIDKLEDSLIKKLLDFYISRTSKNINDRGDISNQKFLKELSFAVGKERKEINFKTMRKIIIMGYSIAFKKEFKSFTGKKGLENLKRYEKDWRKIFGDTLEGVVGDREKAEELFLLAWVEGNAVDHKENSHGAVGYFQILPGTAKNFGMKKRTDLHDYIKSAQIAANYLAYLIKGSKGKDMDKKIYNAILEYNGNWSKRLKPDKREEVSNTILQIEKELNWCKTQVANGNWTILKTIKKIKWTHNQFFKNKLKEGSFHFGILEEWEEYFNSAGWKKREQITEYSKYLENKKAKKPKKIKNNLTEVDKKNLKIEMKLWQTDIIKWINRYEKIILGQQHMYPEQFKAARIAYEEVR